MMNPLRSTLATVAACGLLLSTASAAFAGAQDYQFTGDVTAVTDNSFTVLKGKQSWDFAKDPAKPTGDLKVGDKVTVHYVMTAAKIEPSVKAKTPPKDRAKKAAAPTDAAASPAASPSKPAAADASPKP